MKSVIVTNPARTPISLVDQLADYGSATVHEAMGRLGYLGPNMRPIWPGARVAGNAVTVTVAPGDNLMAHVAVQYAGHGDILVVAPTSPTTDGYFGDVFATSLMQRGVRGLVTDTGIRDIAELKALGFPAWSTAISAQGTVKATLGSVNLSVVIGTVIIAPGDVIVADDDGVSCVPRVLAAQVIEACAGRIRHEEQIKQAMTRGALGLDLYGLRELVERLGIDYIDAANA